MTVTTRTSTGTRRAGAVLLLPAVIAAASLACQARRVVPRPSGPDTARLAELWAPPEPGRDLFHGVGGRRLAPDPGVRYRVIELKFGGFSSGYTVVDPAGREWSAKFPPEAPTEVVASRILWGIGYHQPPIYFLREWEADGADRPNPQLPARFREDEPDLAGLDAVGDWSYYDNPFVGTPQLRGLLVLQAMLGNSDLKDSNNSLYALEQRLEGAAQWYVARDIGQTFGRTGVLDAPRGDIAAFEQTPFVLSVEGDRVDLAYGGRHKALFEQISLADVHWVCRQLNQLTDRQWADAFRAGGYEPGVADRFIRRLKEKVAEGLALSR
jgi:hypothetical protein